MVTSVYTRGHGVGGQGVRSGGQGRCFSSSVRVVRVVRMVRIVRVGLGRRRGQYLTLGNARRQRHEGFDVGRFLASLRRTGSIGGLWVFDLFDRKFWCLRRLGMFIWRLFVHR